MKLLEKMCSIHAPSGEESAMSEFLLKYIKENKINWRKDPVIYHGSEFQDNIILVFGDPKVAVFAHMDSIGFTVRYNNEIIKIGGPVTDNGIKLIGRDSNGKVEGTLINKKGKIYIDSNRVIDPGTSLTFKMNFRNQKEFIQSCYLDNRLGIWNCLELAKTIKNGILVFSSWEEHGGGSVGYLGRFIQKKYNVMRALISDITWVTEGVRHGKGCVISLRDSAIPRREYVNKVIEIAKRSGINFQLEVESSGGSDGNALQRSDFNWDWCFVGAPEDYVHSPNEKVYKTDIKSMNELYKVLLEQL